MNIDQAPERITREFFGGAIRIGGSRAAFRATASFFVLVAMGAGALGVTGAWRSVVAPIQNILVARATLSAEVASSLPFPEPEVSSPIVVVEPTEGSSTPPSTPISSSASEKDGGPKPSVPKKTAIPQRPVSTPVVSVEPTIAESVAPNPPSAELPSVAEPISPPVITEPPVPAQKTTPITLQMIGAGDAVVQAGDYRFSCSANCVVNYPVDTALSLSVYPENDTVFQGWGGACSGTGDCGLFVNGPTTLSVSIATVPAITVPLVEDDDRQSSGASGWILVSEVMSGSAMNPDDEYIELYNPTSQPILLTGWRIKRKERDGSESPLVPSRWFENRIIPANGYLLLARAGSYQGSVIPDIMWPDYSLRSTDDTIRLYDGLGSRVEEISWRNVPIGRSWTRTSFSGNDFEIALPTPRDAGR